MANNFNPNGQYLAEVDFGIKTNITVDSKAIAADAKRAINDAHKIIDKAVATEASNPSSTGVNIERQIKELDARFGKSIEKRIVHTIQAYNAVGNYFENGNYGHVGIAGSIKGIGEALSRVFKKQIEFGVTAADDIVKTIEKAKYTDINRAELKQLTQTHLVSAQRAIETAIGKRLQESSAAVEKLATLEAKIADQLKAAGTDISTITILEERAKKLETASRLYTEADAQHAAVAAQASTAQGKVSASTLNIANLTKAIKVQQARVARVMQTYSLDLNKPLALQFDSIKKGYEAQVDQLIKANLPKNALRKDPNARWGYSLATKKDGTLNAAAAKLEPQLKALERALNQLQVDASIFQPAFTAISGLNKQIAQEQAALAAAQQDLTRYSARRQRIHKVAQWRDARLKGLPQLTGAEQDLLTAFAEIREEYTPLKTRVTRNAASMKQLENTNKDLTALIEAMHKKVYDSLDGELKVFNQSLKSGIQTLLSDKSSGAKKGRTIDFLIGLISGNLDKIEESGDEVLLRYANKLQGFSSFLHSVKKSGHKLADLPNQVQSLYATFGQYNSASNTYGQDARMGFKKGVQAPFKDARLANNAAQNGANQLEYYQQEQNIILAETALKSLSTSSTANDLRAAAQKLMNSKESAFRSIATNLLNTAQLLDDLPHDASLSTLVKAKGKITDASKTNNATISGLPGDLGTRLVTANKDGYNKTLTDLDARITPMRDAVFKEIKGLYAYAETQEKEVVGKRLTAEKALENFSKQALRVAQVLSAIDPNIAARVNTAATQAANYTGAQQPKQQTEAKALLTELVRSTGLSDSDIKKLLTGFDKGTGALDRIEQSQQAAHKSNNTAKQRQRAEDNAARTQAWIDEIDKYLNSIANFSTAHPLQDSATLQAKLTAMNNNLQAVDKNHKPITIADLNERAETRIRGSLKDNKRKTEIDELGGLARSFGIDDNLNNLQLIAESGIYGISKKISHFGYQVFQETFSNLSSLIVFQLGKMLGDAYRRAAEIENVINDVSTVNVTSTGIIERGEGVAAAQRSLRNSIAGAGVAFKNGTEDATTYARGLYDLSYSTETISRNIDLMSKLAKRANRDLGDLTKIALPIDKLYGINNTEVSANLVDSARRNDVSVEKAAENFTTLASDKSIRSALSPKELIDYSVASAKMGREVEANLTTVLNTKREFASVKLKDSNLDEISGTFMLAGDTLKAVGIQFNDFLADLKKAGVSTLFTGIAIAIQAMLAPLQIAVKILAALMNTPFRILIEAAILIRGVTLGFTLLKTAALSVIPALDAQIVKYAALANAQRGTAAASAAASMSMVRGIGAVATALRTVLGFMTGIGGIFVALAGLAYSAYTMFDANRNATREAEKEQKLAIKNIEMELERLARARSIELGVEIDPTDEKFLNDLATGRLEQTGKLAGIDPSKVLSTALDNPNYFSEKQRSELREANSGMQAIRDASNYIKDNITAVGSLVGQDAGPFGKLASAMTTAALASQQMRIAFETLNRPLTNMEKRAIQLPITQSNYALAQANFEVEKQNALYAFQDDLIKNTENKASLTAQLNKAEATQTESNNEGTWVDQERSKLKAQFDLIVNPNQSEREAFLAADKKLWEQKSNAIKEENRQIAEINRLREEVYRNEVQRVAIQRARIEQQIRVVEELTPQLAQTNERLTNDQIIQMGLSEEIAKEAGKLSGKALVNYLNQQLLTFREQLANLKPGPRQQRLNSKPELGDYNSDFQQKLKSNAPTINGDEIVSSTLNVLQSYADANKLLLDSPEAQQIRGIVANLERQLDNPDGVVWDQGRVQSLAGVKAAVETYKGILDLMESNGKIIRDLKFTGMNITDPTKRMAAQLDALRGGIQNIRKATTAFLNEKGLNAKEFSAKAGTLEGELKKIVDNVRQNIESLRERLLGLASDITNRIENNRDSLELRQLKAKYKAGLTSDLDREMADAKAEAEIQYKKDMREIKRIEEQNKLQKDFIEDIKSGVTEWKLAIDRNTEALKRVTPEVNEYVTPVTPPTPEYNYQTKPVNAADLIPEAPEPTYAPKDKDKTPGVKDTIPVPLPVIVTNVPKPTTTSTPKTPASTYVTTNNTYNTYNTSNVYNTTQPTKQPGVQPGQPTQPSQPSQPVKPTQPGAPTQPSNQPTTGNQPGKPTGTQPGTGTNPTQPSQPTQNPQPGQPTPNQPNTGQRPAQPTQPNQPVQDDDDDDQTGSSGGIKNPVQVPNPAGAPVPVQTPPRPVVINPPRPNTRKPPISNPGVTNPQEEPTEQPPITTPTPPAPVYALSAELAHAFSSLENALIRVSNSFTNSIGSLATTISNLGTLPENAGNTANIPNLTPAFTAIDSTMQRLSSSMTTNITNLVTALNNFTIPQVNLPKVNINTSDIAKALANAFSNLSLTLEYPDPNKAPKLRMPAPDPNDDVIPALRIPSFKGITLPEFKLPANSAITSLAESFTSSIKTGLNNVRIATATIAEVIAPRVSLVVTPNGQVYQMTGNGGTGNGSGRTTGTPTVTPTTPPTQGATTSGPPKPQGTGSGTPTQPTASGSGSISKPKYSFLNETQVNAARVAASKLGVPLNSFFSNPNNANKINGYGNLGLNALFTADMFVNLLGNEAFGIPNTIKKMSAELNITPSDSNKGKAPVQGITLFVGPAPVQQFATDALSNVLKKPVVTFIVGADVIGGYQHPIEWKYQVYSPNNGSVKVKITKQSDVRIAKVEVELTKEKHSQVIEIAITASAGGKSETVVLTAVDPLSSSIASNNTQQNVPAIGGGTLGSNVNAATTFGATSAGALSSAKIGANADLGSDYYYSSVASGNMKLSDVPTQHQNEIQYRLANPGKIWGTLAHGSPNAAGILSSGEIWPGITPGSYSTRTNWRHAGWGIYGAQDNLTVGAYRDSPKTIEQQQNPQLRGAVQFRVALPESAMKDFDMVDWENFSYKYAADKLGLKFDPKMLVPKSTDYLSHRDPVSGKYADPFTSNLKEIVAYSLDFNQKQGMTPEEARKQMERSVFPFTKEEFAERFRKDSKLYNPDVKAVVKALEDSSGTNALAKEAAQAYNARAIKDGVKIFRYQASGFYGKDGQSPTHYNIIDPSVMDELKPYDTRTQQIPRGFVSVDGDWNSNVSFANSEVARKFYQDPRATYINSKAKWFPTSVPTGTETPRVGFGARILNNLGNLARGAAPILDNIGVVGEVAGGLIERATGQQPWLPPGFDQIPGALGLSKLTIKTGNQKVFKNKEKEGYWTYVIPAYLADNAAYSPYSDITAKLTSGKGNVSVRTAPKSTTSTITVKVYSGDVKIEISSSRASSISLTLKGPRPTANVGGGNLTADTAGTPVSTIYNKVKQVAADPVWQAFGSNKMSLASGVDYSTIPGISPDIIKKLPKYHKGTDLVISDDMVYNPFNGAKVKSVSIGKGKDGVTGEGDLNKDGRRDSDDDGAGDGFGQKMILQLQDGFEMILSHFDKIFVKPGDIIQSGDLLGVQGATGTVTGKHLHTELMRDGKSFINPQEVSAIVRALIGFGNGRSEDVRPEHLPEFKPQPLTAEEMAISTGAVFINTNAVKPEPPVTRTTTPANGSVSAVPNRGSNDVPMSAPEDVRPARTSIASTPTFARGSTDIDPINIKPITDTQQYAVTPVTRDVTTGANGQVIVSAGSAKALDDLTTATEIISDSIPDVIDLASKSYNDSANVIPQIDRALKVAEAIETKFLSFIASLKQTLQSGITKLLSIPREFFKLQKEKAERVKEMTFQGASIEAQRASLQGQVSEVQSKMARSKTVEEYNGYVQQLQQIEGQLREVNTQYAVWQEGMRQTKAEGMKFGDFFAGLFEDLGNQVMDLASQYSGDYIMAALFGEQDERGFAGGTHSTYADAQNYQRNPQTPPSPFSVKFAGVGISGSTEFGARYRQSEDIPAIGGGDLGLAQFDVSMDKVVEYTGQMVDQGAEHLKISKQGFADGLTAALQSIAIQFVIAAAINIFRSAMTKRESDSKKFTAPLDFDTTRGTANPTGVRQLTVNTTVNGANAAEVSRITSQQVDKSMNRLRFGV